MKSYENCEFEHEKLAFGELDTSFLCGDDIEIYPNFELFDDSKKAYLECDLVVISKGHCAIVELKHWRGEITVSHDLWYRGYRAVPDPHRSNNRKCKVLRSTIEKILPAVSKIPFVHSIVVLTNPAGEVSGADSVNPLFKQDSIQGQITFDGIPSLADYLKKRSKRTHRNSLSDGDFSRVRAYFDKIFDQPKAEYTDQIPGYSIVDELEHTNSYSSYLAAKIPPLGDILYRLRVFGVLSDDPIKNARQVRSLKELGTLDKHENIHHASQCPNEKKLVVEVSEWLGFETLEQRLGQVGQIAWPHASEIALGVAKALLHIHSSDQMLVHRNLSPKSILLNSDDIPQLTDFDLVYDPTEEYTVFEPPAKEYLPYMAPEVHMGDADPRSDIYSWGVTFFTMLAGEPPKKRGDGILSEGLNPQHLDKLPTDVPAELRGLLVDVMKFDAACRPEAVEVVGRLQGVLPEHVSSKVSTLARSSNTWILGDLLAEGSTSEVYKGDCHGEQAALKLYSPEVSKDRCLHERSMLLESDSPCIPKYKSFMQWDDGRWCLVMEYVEGCKLKDLIKNGKRPSLNDFLSVANQLLETLLAMHPNIENDASVGVIHNDINPNNILVDELSGRTVLIDFGAASTPGPVTYRGTRGYIAPDLLDAGELDASPSGDIYGLGVTLWEWLVGKRPNESHNLNDIDLEECSEQQRKRLYNWFGQCWGGEDERFRSAEFALSAFREITNEDVCITEISSEEQDRVVISAECNHEAAQDCHAPSFVSYLNTMHNVTANNVHALAEAQSINPYFVDIYEPISLVGDICDYLTGEDPVVLVLTGHAGDGKSTIALDVLKKLKNLPEDKQLDAPPIEVEKVILGERRCVYIVKDMSELSAEARIEILTDSLDEKDGEFVSWLIVSNTGPLLSSFSALKKSDEEKLQVEDAILGVLNQPVDGSISSEEHCLNGFKKPVLLVNLAKLNNVGVASNVLGRIVAHPSWEHCDSCDARECCHITLNVTALKEAGSISRERVRWIYTRLSSYGQRMTLRQMSSHLAYSLTAGFNCKKIRKKKRSFSTASEQEDFLASHVFSNTFFGGSEAKESAANSALYCMKLLKYHHFGVHSSPQIERSILNEDFADWASVPVSLGPTTHYLAGKSSKPGNKDSRQSLRRLIYMFADLNDGASSFSRNYCNHFLKSSRLIDLERWAYKGAIVASRAEKRALLDNTLAVLLEEYSGFSIGQYGATKKLYVTLKRSDRNVHQPSQLVLAEFSFDEFKLVFDEKKRIPRLIHKDYQEEKGLEMSLPLLDYITSRGAGDLDCGLDPIYANQIEHFRSQLLAIQHTKNEEDSHGVITLIKAGIEGEVKTYSYELSDDDKCLEGL
ncbi:MAG: NERD domain-containing serine/threonine-protein kinase [Desulfuromusa sp.]|jgi:serine/threonine protein kinase|nr:NERD domain-containing serine/threonine-protein kinase [Desulfuromusa sp.]